MMLILTHFKKVKHTHNSIGSKRFVNLLANFPILLLIGRKNTSTLHLKNSNI